MLNDQLSRILSSRPDSLLTAIHSNNQDLLALQNLLQQRGKQITSLQYILSGEVGLVEKMVRVKGRLGEVEKKVRGVREEIGGLRVEVGEEVRRVHGELMGEMAGVMRGMWVDKKEREEEVKRLKGEVERLQQEVKNRRERQQERQQQRQQQRQRQREQDIDILHIQPSPSSSPSQSSQLQAIQLHSRIPLLETGGYTLGNSSLKQLFSPLAQTLSLSDIKSLKSHPNPIPISNHGKSQILYQKGYLFKGCLKNGQRHGFGQLFYHNQIVYRGDWKKDVFWGKGVLQMGGLETGFEGAVVYMGNFEGGEFEGMGVIQFEDGRRWMGEFGRGKVRGEGMVSRGEEMGLGQCWSGERIGRRGMICGK